MRPLRKKGKQVDCEPRFHGESYGWDVQFLYDGGLAYGRRYLMRKDAVEEAEAQRTRLIDEGWAQPTPETVADSKIGDADEALKR